MSQNNRVGHPKSSFSTEITKNYQIWQNKPCRTLGSNQILGSSWRVLGEREPLDFRGKHYFPCWQWHEDSSPCSWCSLLKVEDRYKPLFSTVLCILSSIDGSPGEQCSTWSVRLTPHGCSTFLRWAASCTTKACTGKGLLKRYAADSQNPKRKKKKLERRIEGRNNIWKDHCIHKEKQSMHVHDWCLLRRD